jgi:sugar fermentation stimulation protein A
MTPAEAGTVAFGPLVPARYLSRPNRYLMVTRQAGRVVLAACRDPGRLEHLLAPGVALLLRRAPGAKRRTRYDVVLVRSGRVWTSLVPVLANEIVDAAIRAGTARGLRGARVLAREVTRGRSRFDFLLAHRGHQVLAEVKSVGLVRDGCALFPDAPTVRGTRHVRELAAHAREGGAALAVFVAQRPDARAVAPHREIDPDFADAVAEARRAGVRFLAYNCRVSPTRCRLDERIPVLAG